MIELIEGWLRHKSDMVNLEAARAICEMKNVTAAQLTKPIAGMLRRTGLPCSHMSNQLTSIAAIPFVSQILPPIRRHPYSRDACPYAPEQRRYVQCRPREPHFRFKP